MMDVFIKLDPIWSDEDDCLYYNAEASHEPETFRQATMCVSIGRRLFKWSLTRWGKAGLAGRLFIRGRVLGLNRHVKQVKADSTYSDYNLNGWDKAGLGVTLFLCVFGLASIPFEMFILSLIKDDRLLLHFSGLKVAVFEKMFHVLTLPTLVWDRLAAVAMTTSEALRHETFKAMMIMFCWWWREVMYEVERLPLKLTQGDIKRNVDELASGVFDAELVDEPVARRWRGCLQLGSARALVVLLTLLLNAPMSTAIVEQAHASSAVLMRQH